MTLPAPYYSHGGITIYHADCRDILPALVESRGKFDLLLTDPPYGIASIWSKGGARHGWGKAHAQIDERNAWDISPPTRETLDAQRKSTAAQVYWGGNYFELPPSRGWLVWNKPERNFSLAEAELAWTSLDMVIRVLDCVRSEPGRTHPTQKPMRLMRWCLSFLPEAKTVLDPYMGSGPVARACKDAGLQYVGIEIVEKYCEIAVKRLAQEVLAL